MVFTRTDEFDFNSQIVILVLGLDNAGKTSIVNYLHRSKCMKANLKSAISAGYKVDSHFRKVHERRSDTHERIQNGEFQI